MFIRYLLGIAFYGVISLSAVASSNLQDIVKQQEQQIKADIGVALLAEDGKILFNYQGERSFPLNSTHKAFTCAMILEQVDQHQLVLSQKILISPEERVNYSPITQHKTELDLATLCSASVSYSDNTAANLIIKQLGGPQAISDNIKERGFRYTHLNRLEPNLNKDNLTKRLDLTTPIEAAQLLRQFVLGDWLSLHSKRQLTQWLLDDQVADELLRATLPKDWKIGDKTGAGSNGSRSIISVFWSPSGKTYVLAIYLTNTQATISQRNKAIAEIGRAVFDSLQ